MKKKTRQAPLMIAQPPDIVLFDDWRIITHTADEDDALNQILDMIADNLQEDLATTQFCIFPFEKGDDGINFLCLSLTSKPSEKLVV